MRSQKGVIYPIVIMLCFIVLIFFSYMTERIFSERQFVYLDEEQRREIRLVQQALKKTFQVLTDTGSDRAEYYFTWTEGNVKVTVNPGTTEEKVIEIEAITKQQHTKKVKVYYNVSQDSVTKWVEG
jgi:hypothetical protein